MHEGEKRAAEDLAHFIKKMTGAELKIVNAPSGSLNRLFVGESKFTQKSRSGKIFLITCRGKGI